MRDSISAGMVIGLAGWANLNTGGVVGAILFSFGLLIVCYNQLELYTGMAGKVDLETKSFLKLFAVLAGNVVGAAIMGFISRTSVSEIAHGVVMARLGTDLWTAFAKGIGCGMLMEFAVWTFRNNGTVVAIFVCVPAFILGGMYHCVADAYYYAAGVTEWDFSVLYVFAVTILGNLAGCNIGRFVHGKPKK